jgi:hypothetical protein
VRIIDFPQGSAEWRAARAGKVTASCMDKVLAKIKTGEAAARRDYRAQIVAEILTGQPQDSGFVNDEMRWGIEQEPFAGRRLRGALQQVHRPDRPGGAPVDRALGSVARPACR